MTTPADSAWQFLIARAELMSPAKTSEAESSLKDELSPIFIRQTVELFTRVCMMLLSTVQALNRTQTCYFVDSGGRYGVSLPAAHVRLHQLSECWICQFPRLPVYKGDDIFECHFFFCLSLLLLLSE